MFYSLVGWVLAAWLARAKQHALQSLQSTTSPATPATGSFGSGCPPRRHAQQADEPAAGRERPKELDNRVETQALAGDSSENDSSLNYAESEREECVRKGGLLRLAMRGL
jgi:hypothetical protein